MTVDFDPSSFIGLRVRFSLEGEDHVGVLADYSPSTEWFEFVRGSVYLSGEYISEYRFPRQEFWPTFGGNILALDDSERGRAFNSNVMAKKLADMRLEEEADMRLEEEADMRLEEEEEEEKVDRKLEEEETVVGNSTTTNGDEPQGLQVDVGVDTVDQFLLPPNGSSGSKRKLHHDLVLPSTDSSHATGSSSLTSSHSDSNSSSILPSNSSSTLPSNSSSILPSNSSSTLPSNSSSTLPSNSSSTLPRVPDQDPIRRLFLECEEEANRPDSDDEWKEEESTNQGVEYWLDEIELPSIGAVDFEDLRKETLSDEAAQGLVDEISSFERISFDAFGERIERRFPVEYVAICGQTVTGDGMYRLKIFLLPLQSTEKITPSTRQVISILRTIFSQTLKLVHMCLFLSEVLNKRYGIDFRFPMKSLTDTSILDAYHRQNMVLRKAPINGQVRVREEIKIRPLEECLTHYLHLDLTAEFFPRCGRDDEYLCLRSTGVGGANGANGGNGGITNAGKNFLIRRIGLLFSLEDALHDEMFGIIDNGIMNISSKMLCGEKQASDLRLRYLNRGIKAGEVLQIEDTIAANLEVLIGRDFPMVHHQEEVGRDFSMVHHQDEVGREFSMVRHRDDGVNQLNGCPSKPVQDPTSARVRTKDPTSARVRMNGQSPVSSGTEASLPAKSHPRKRIQLGNNVKSIGSSVGPFPSNPATESDTSPPSTDERGQKNTDERGKKSTEDRGQESTDERGKKNTEDRGQESTDERQKSSLGSHSTLHHVLNHLHRERRGEKGVIDWGTPEPGQEPCKAPPPAGSEYRWWTERTLQMNRLEKNLPSPTPSPPPSSSARNHAKGLNSLSSAPSISLMTPRSVKCPGLRRQLKQVRDG